MVGTVVITLVDYIMKDFQLWTCVKLSQVLGKRVNGNIDIFIFLQKWY